MEAKCQYTNIIAVLKKIEKIRKCNICGATELISLTGSCSHSLCSECLRGLADSICPECSTPFDLKAILPNIQWSNFSHEINNIANIVNRVVKPSPFNNLPDEVLKDIEHGETHMHETSAEPNSSEKSNKKGSIYKRKLKLASTSQNENELPKSNVPTKEGLKDINENTPVFVSNENESVDVIGNSQSPIKKNVLFAKQKVENVSNVKKSNVLSENNLPVRRCKISRSCVSRRAETDNFVRKPDKVRLNSSSDSELNFKGFPSDAACITISPGSEDGSSDNSDTYQRKKKTSLNNDHVENFSRNNKRIIEKNCSNSVSSENTDLNESCVSSKKKKNIPKQSKKIVRRNSKEGKSVCELENDSSEIIPATPQDAAVVALLPVSTRAKKQLTSLNVNSTKRRDSVKRNRNGETPLLSACAKGNLAEVERLISEGADPNIKDYAGWTPLHEAVIKGDMRIVEALVQAGANINTPGYLNITPLLEAVLQDNHEAAAFLLRLGADRHIRSLYNNRPLDCARGDEMIKLLNQLHAPSSGTEPATNYSMPEPFCLCPISLNAEQCQTLREFCVKFDLKCVESLRSEVTHAIVATQDNNVCKTDVNILKCLANGTAVISFNWIQYSLKLAVMSKSDVWEVHGTEEFPGSGAFMKSRINSQKMLPKLLNGLHVSLSLNWSGGWRDLSKADVMDLVKEAGAVLLKREADPHTTPDDEKTVMFHASCDGPMGICSHVTLYVPGLKEPELKYNMTHHKTLSVKWLTDCLQTFSIVDPL